MLLQEIKSLKNSSKYLLLVGFVTVAFHGNGRTGQIEKLVLTTHHVRVAGGELALVELPSTTADFVRSAAKISAETAPAGELQISVGQDARTGSLVIAPPPTMPPGRYFVELSVTDSQGEHHTATLQVTVDPIPPIALSSSIPVLLLTAC